VSVSAVAAPEARAPARARGLAPWWPLAALTLLAAVLRLTTLGEQSFWYDEAFTPVHVLRGGLGATLHAVVHTENTPPLWYVLAWADARVFGDGPLALRLPSALAGIATVPVVWAIAQRLTGRRTAVVAAAIVAVDPLLVWYSQEARAYGLFVLLSAVAMLCFVRALQAPSRARLLAFALAGALALLTHYFAVFLLIPMCAWLLLDARARGAALAATGAIGVVGLALLALISAQGGHGTQWIGRWALSSRLQAIPQYYLTGYSGAPLGHGVELLVALPILLGVALGAWRLFASRAGAGAGGAPADATGGGAAAGEPADELSSARRAVWIALSIAAFGVLAPIVLVGFGADYLAPRNLVGATIAVTVLVAVLLANADLSVAGLQAKAVAMAVATAAVLALLAISLDVDASPRLQRGDWRGVANVLRRHGAGAGARAITTVELGAAPLEYYLPDLRLRNLARHASVSISEIDEIGYAPLRASAGRPPARGFRLSESGQANGLIYYRFLSSSARPVSEAQLRRHVITLAHPEVLVPAAAPVSDAPPKAP
jgi:mannosyltransferase